MYFTYVIIDQDKLDICWPQKTFTNSVETYKDIHTSWALKQVV